MLRAKREVAVQADYAAIDLLISGRASALQVGTGAGDVKGIGVPGGIKRVGRACQNLAHREPGRLIGEQVVLDSGLVRGAQERIVDRDLEHTAYRPRRTEDVGVVGRLRDEVPGVAL